MPWPILNQHLDAPGVLVVPGLGALEFPPGEGEILPGGGACKYKVQLFGLCVHATNEILFEFLCHASKKYYFTHVISHDSHFKLGLTGLPFLATVEALKTDLSDTFMLVVPPSDPIHDLS